MHKAAPLHVLGFSFNHTTAAFLSVILFFYHHLADWQVKSELLGKYKDLDKIWWLKGLTHKAYIHEALTSVHVVAKEIQHRIDQGNPDGRETAELRSHMGILDTEVSALPSRENDIRSLLTEQDSISMHFFALDKRPGEQERILEELFLHILKTTVVPLMGKASNLIVSKDEPVFFPYSYAPIVWQETLKTGRRDDGTHDSLPSATCLLPFNKFRENYEMSQRPISKAKRLYIPRDEANGKSWKDMLREELKALENNSFNGLPKPMAADGSQAFNNHFICHFAWIVDYHKRVEWELKFLEWTEFKRYFESSHPAELKYMDFLVASCIHSRAPIVFSVDIDAVDDGVRHIGLPVEMRRVQVFWDNENRVFPFYNMIWDIARTPKAFMDAIDLYANETPPSTYTALMNYLNSVNQ